MPGTWCLVRGTRGLRIIREKKPCFCVEPRIRLNTRTMELKNEVTNRRGRKSPFLILKTTCIVNALTVHMIKNIPGLLSMLIFSTVIVLRAGLAKTRLYTRPVISVFLRQLWPKEVIVFFLNRSINSARKRTSAVSYPIGRLQRITCKVFSSKFRKTGRRSAWPIKRLVMASPACTTTVVATSVVELICLVQCRRHHLSSGQY